MLQLVNPIALLASAAVIIPVLIHLWNIRKGKTLKVGSIALIAESSRQPARSRRITNWPLFILRCLLLLLLACLLANPFWETNKKTSAGWILIPRQHLHQVYQTNKTSIDSLLKAGLKLHDLSSSFDQLTLQDTTSSTIQSDIPVWALLKQLNTRLPKNFPLHVFASNKLVDYYGERPATQLDLHWNGFDTGSNTSTSPAFTYSTPDNKTKSIKWVTTSSGNYYADDSLAISSSVDTTPVRVTIYAGKNITDAYYLKAAFKAISQYTGRNIIVYTQPTAQPQQLICWLQDSTPGEEILSTLSPSGALLQYDQGTDTPVFAPFNTGRYSLADGRPQSFYKYVSGPSAGNSIWTLSDGRPLLTLEEKNGRRIIHFKSRFNPQWTDLVWQEDFVRALLPLTLIDPSKENIDLRQIDSAQAKPGKLSDSSSVSTNASYFEKSKDLSLIFWIAILIVFIAERIVAHHSSKKTKDA